MYIFYYLTAIISSAGLQLQQCEAAQCQWPAITRQPRSQIITQHQLLAGAQELSFEHPFFQEFIRHKGVELQVVVFLQDTVIYKHFILKIEL